MAFRRSRSRISSAATSLPSNPQPDYGRLPVACGKAIWINCLCSLPGAAGRHSSTIQRIGAFVRNAWTRMPKRGGTTIADGPGHASRQWSAPGTRLGSRLTVADVSAVVCFSFGLRLPDSPDCFAVNAMLSSRREGFSAAIKQTCCRLPRWSARPSAKEGCSLNALRRQAVSSGRRGRKGCPLSPRWVYRCLMASDRQLQQARLRWPAFHRHGEP